MTSYTCPISNYYGRPYVREANGKYFFCLDDWDRRKEIEVSYTFYTTWRKEFQEYVKEDGGSCT